MTPWSKFYRTRSSDLERIEEQVTEETNEAQHRALRDRLVNDKCEEYGVNPKQGDKSQSGFC